MSFRTYHEVAGPDRSALGEQVAAQRARVRERLRGVHRVVAVVSGKGGVGKSWITAALASRLARQGAVGVLDADLESPTVARLLDARGALRVDARAVHPVIAREGIAVVSTELLLDEGAPLRWNGPEGDRFVWRGALEAGALREMLGDVAWGTLTLLLADLPPDAGRLEDLAELVPDLAGAIVVTIPSEESRRSVERAMHRADRLGVRLLGIVENMSGYACGSCGDVGPLFEGDAGAWLASRFAVPLLGRVPFIPGAAPDGAAAPLDRLARSVQEVLA